MLPISTKMTARFTPDDKAGVEAPPVYLLRVPTYRDRLMLDRDVEATGVPRVQAADLLRALREGVKAVVAEDQQPRLLEAIDQAEAAAKDPDFPDRAQLAAELDRIKAALRRHYPPFVELEADQRVRFFLMADLALQRFLMGWENVAGPDGAALKFARIAGRVPEELLERLPPGDRAAAALQAFNLVFVTEGERKNSAPPASSPTSPRPSPAASAPPTAAPDGTSAATSGSTTPASS